MVYFHVIGTLYSGSDVNEKQAWSVGLVVMLQQLLDLPF